MTDIAGRFASETAEHQMTTLRDEGLYRHLRFKAPTTGMYWFDLIAVPGTLIFQGDGNSFVFRAALDMFEFFRSASQGRPNIRYWAQKLTDRHDSVMAYDQELLVNCVEDVLAEHYDEEPVPTELLRAVRAEVLDELCGDETHDRWLVDKFEWYAEEEDRYAYPKKAPDFHFTDTFEWQCQDYDWWYQWACHAIVWGISRYDGRPDTRVSVTATTGGAAAADHRGRPVVDVHLPDATAS